jgi:hypothetical protein
MSSGDLIPNDHVHVEPVANEVQFPLVIARMIDTVKNSPEHNAPGRLRSCPLQTPGTVHPCGRERYIQRAQQALKKAISVTVRSRAASPLRILPLRIGLRQPARQIDPTPAVQSALGYPVWPIIKRAAAMLIILGGVFVVIQERGRLASVVHSLSGYQKQIASEQPPAA